MTESTPIPPSLLPELASPTPHLWALIPCAGTGSRAGTAQPKQYEWVAGQPLVKHTLHAFAGVSSLAGTLVVVAPDDELFTPLVSDNVSGSSAVLVANCGGSTRAGSVLNGLNHLINLGAGANDWVLVHDAARCLVTPAQIQALIDACLTDEVGGLLAHKLPDTLKTEVQGRVSSTIARDDKWLAQTPQMFRIGALIAAMQFAGDKVTDESSAMEASGLAPRLVSGSAQNFKVTYPEDFALAEAILHSRQQAVTVPRRAATSSSEPYDYP